jgi:hypothetical protein
MKKAAGGAARSAPDDVFGIEPNVRSCTGSSAQLAAKRRHALGPGRSGGGAKPWRQRGATRPPGLDHAHSGEAAACPWPQTATTRSTPKMVSSPLRRAPTARGEEDHRVDDWGSGPRPRTREAARASGCEEGRPRPRPRRAVPRDERRVEVAPQPGGRAIVLPEESTPTALNDWLVLSRRARHDRRASDSATRDETG